MTRTLILSALLILSASLSACGGESSPADECNLTWQGQPVPCEHADTASSPEGS